MKLFDDALLDRERRKSGRVWAWGPQWYWPGWRAWLPVMVGHDELARRTLVVGWTITGRVIIALGDCGDQSCRDDAVREILAGSGSTGQAPDEND